MSKQRLKGYQPNTDNVFIPTKSIKTEPPITLSKDGNIDLLSQRKTEEKILGIIDKMQHEATAMLRKAINVEDEQYYSGIIHACSMLKIAVGGIE